MSDIIVAITSILALLYVICINVVYYNISKQRLSASIKMHANCLQNPARLSAIALNLLLICPLFICLSYFHPERFIFNENSDLHCFCSFWFICAIIAYVVAVYLIKVTYFINIYIIQKNLRTEKMPLSFKLAIGNTVFVGSAIIIFQPFAISGECHDDSQFGCTFSFLPHSMCMISFFLVECIQEFK